jgi:condensin-2 complex subunit G2
MEAFPIQDPESSRADSDALLVQQFDAISTALDDADVNVRVTAVHGTARVLGVYWELIPVGVATGLMNKLSALAGDARCDIEGHPRFAAACSSLTLCHVSSGAVRAAVFKGMEFMLDNRLIHPLLASLLPKLAQYAHDRTEGVRAAFVDMLAAVKRLRTIKFSSIVKPEHLLARWAQASSFRAHAAATLTGSRASRPACASVSSAFCSTPTSPTTSPPLSRCHLSLYACWLHWAPFPTPLRAGAPCHAPAA